MSLPGTGLRCATTCPSRTHPSSCFAKHTMPERVRGYKNIVRQPKRPKLSHDRFESNASQLQLSCWPMLAFFLERDCTGGQGGLGFGQIRAQLVLCLDQCMSAREGFPEAVQIIAAPLIHCMRTEAKETHGRGGGIQTLYIGKR